MENRELRVEDGELSGSGPSGARSVFRYFAGIVPISGLAPVGPLPVLLPQEFNP